MSLQIPVPDSFLAAVWFGIDLTFGRGFGRNLDRPVQALDAFKRQSMLAQTLIKNALNLLHHFWVGLLLLI